MNEDLQDWNTSLHKQIQYEREKNDLARACRKCGDKAFYLTKEKSGLGYDCLCMNVCSCNLGVNLKDKWLRQQEEKNKKGE